MNNGEKPKKNNDNHNRINNKHNDENDDKEHHHTEQPQQAINNNENCSEHLILAGKYYFQFQNFLFVHFGFNKSFFFSHERRDTLISNFFLRVPSKFFKQIPFPLRVFFFRNKFIVRFVLFFEETRGWKADSQHQTGEKIENNEHKNNDNKNRNNNKQYRNDDNNDDHANNNEHDRGSCCKQRNSNEDNNNTKRGENK